MKEQAALPEPVASAGALAGAELLQRRKSLPQQPGSVSQPSACFTSHADTKTEAWRPYEEWANRLQKQEFVLSFNYDLVLEILLESRALEFESR